MNELKYYYNNGTKHKKLRNSNIDYIIKRLKKEWEQIDIPLNIEIVDFKVKIWHKYPDNIGEVAELRLFPKLAYILGFNEEETELGQHLRFDQEKEFTAPHEPKSFASIEDLCLMDQLNELDNLKMDLRKILVDCIDRDRKGISKISDFGKIKDEDSWIIKGTVVNGETIDVGNDETLFVLKIKDHSGEMDVKAFGMFGSVLQKLAQSGSQYYIEKVLEWEDNSYAYYKKAKIEEEHATPDNLAVRINDATYRVKISKV